MGDHIEIPDSRGSTPGEVEYEVTAPEVAEQGSTPKLKREQSLHRKKKFDYHPGVNAAAKAAVASILLVFALHIITFYIYFGSLWNLEQGYPNLGVGIVNADQPFFGVSVGSIIETSVTTHMSTAKPGAPFLGWKQLSSDVSLDQLKSDVDNQQYWFGLYIPQTFTQQLFEAIQGVGSREYTGTVYMVYDEGRQYSTITTAKSMFNTLLVNIGYSLSERILEGAFGPVNLTAAVPSAIAVPVPITLVNLHPVGSIGQHFSTYLGFILLWLSCIYTVNVVGMAAKNLENPGSKYWIPRRLLRVRVVLSTFSGFILSLLMAAIFWGFDDRFEYGFGVFVLFVWLVAMTNITLIASINALLGVPAIMLTTLLLYLQISSSSSIYSDAIMNPFFGAIGPIFPMFHSVQGSRTILFGSANDLWINVVCLFAWLIACTIGMFITVHFSIKKSLKQLMRKEQPLVQHVIHDLAKSMHM